MRTDDFDFELSEELIAQVPVSPRDQARLLCVDCGLSDHIVCDLPYLLKPGDLLVANNTKVIPARLSGFRRNTQGGQARIEITLHQSCGLGDWRVFAKPAKKLKTGDTIRFSSDLGAEVQGREPDGQVLLRFNHSGEILEKALEEQGIMPLPPYISRPMQGDPRDNISYQTIFARQSGAVAAPTAGLHFTPELLNALEEKGIDRIELTLHVGGGTFLPVKTDEIEGHKMHSEWGEITETAAKKINATRADGGRIVAVGTTSLRLLESAFIEGAIQPFKGKTDIYITPGHTIKSADLLLTNFHLPRSTLFILVSAFSGLKRMHAAYEHAKASGYRFYSYGDACLLTREDLIR